MKLAQLYAQFHESILRDDASGVALKPHPRLTAQQQLAIYQDGYRSRLLGLLSEGYEATRAALGEQAFDALAREYIERTPPAHFNIDRYAFGFAAFLHDKAPIPVSELAQLEGAVAEIFWAEESPALSPQSFIALGAESFAEMRLQPRVASRLLRFTHPVNDWLTLFREGRVSPPPAPADEYLMLVRHRAQVQRHSLSAPGFALLSRLVQGMKVGEALDAAMQENESFAAEINAQLQPWFSAWVAQGFFKD